MPKIYQDFIGKYAFIRGYTFRPPDNRTLFSVDEKPLGKWKTFAGAPSSYLFENGEQWWPAGLESYYKGIMKALEQELISEEEYKTLTCFQELNTNFRNQSAFNEFDWPGRDLINKPYYDNYYKLACRVEYIVYVAYGYHLVNFEKSEYDGLKTLLKDPPVPLDAEIRKPERLRVKCSSQLQSQ